MFMSSKRSDEKHFTKSVSLPFSLMTRAEEYCKNNNKQFSELVTGTLREFLDSHVSDQYEMKIKQAELEAEKANARLAEAKKEAQRFAEAEERRNAVRSTKEYIDALDEFTRANADGLNNNTLTSTNVEARIVSFSKRFGITTAAVKEDTERRRTEVERKRDEESASVETLMSNPEYWEDLKAYNQEVAAAQTLKDYMAERRLTDALCLKWSVNPGVIKRHAKQVA
jgi:hypothetical protein